MDKLMVNFDLKDLRGTDFEKALELEGRMKDIINYLKYLKSSAVQYGKGDEHFGIVLNTEDTQIRLGRFVGRTRQCCKTDSAPKCTVNREKCTVGFSK